jgi:large subunit ribosomal protein L19
MEAETEEEGGLRNPLTGVEPAYGIIYGPSRMFLAANCCLCRENAMSEKLKAVELPVNPNVPALNPGDTVSVHVKIKEGEKERIQEFRGTVIRLRKGGSQANFTVRRIASHGIGVERTFPLRSPSLDKVVVQKGAKVRRAQLYFLRNLKGKRARLHGKSEGG